MCFHEYLYTLQNGHTTLTTHPRRLDVLTHQSLHTHQRPVPDFGIIMPNQLDQPRLAPQVCDCLFGLVTSVNNVFANIVCCDRKDDWIAG